MSSLYSGTATTPSSEASRGPDGWLEYPRAITQLHGLYSGFEHSEFRSTVDEVFKSVAHAAALSYFIQTISSLECIITVVLAPPESAYDAIERESSRYIRLDDGRIREVYKTTAHSSSRSPEFTIIMAESWNCNISSKNISNFIISTIESVK
jgi:hypothetical protein